MTYAEALDLLQLSPAEAADVRRIRDAYARRRTQLQNQLNAAAAAPLRAAYQETLAAVDMAAAMLQTRAKLPAPHAGTESGSPATSANGAGGEKPDWIAATPWHNIRNDAGEYQSAEPPAVPSRKPRAPIQSQKEAEPAATPSMTMRLPDSALSEPPKVEELRPVATTLRSHPESPSDAVTLPHDESAGPSRWGTVMALLLAAGGLAGVAGWAWQAGLIDDLLGGGEVATAPRPSGEGADAAGSDDSGTAADPAGARLDSGASEGSRDPETERQLATRIAEIERLGQELDRLAKELGGATTTDWRAQLADAEKDRQTGAMDAAAEGMARLYDTLRAQTDAASRAVTSRQRLASAGPVGAESAIGKNVAAYLGSLRRQAELSVAEGNYASAAQKYDAAMDARLRLPRDIEQVEAARVAAATEHARAVEALARFELDADSSAAILGEPREELLAGSGSLIEAWLADERSAADLVQEYGEAALFFGDVADRLEQILEHQAVAESSRREREIVEADIASMLAEPEKVLMGANATGKSAQDAEAALRGGELDEALRGYKAAAGEEAELLEAAVRVRELAERRSTARKRISEELPRTAARFEQWEAQLRQRAEADGQPEGDSPWEAALTRLAADRRALEVIAAPISVDFSGDKAELETSAQEAELRVQTYEVVAAGLEQLISAEYRLMLLRQLAAGADVVVPEETEIALRRAAKAHADVEELGEGDLTRAGVELAEQSMSEAVEQSDKAAIELSAPAAAKLSDMLIAAQKSYASQFGGIDLAGVWQPEELPAGVAPPAEFADDVAQGLAANADRDALQKELSSGSIDEAEAVLRHVRGLGDAEASLARLRELGSQKDEEGMSPLHHSAAAGQSREVQALLELRVDAAPRDSQGRTPLGLALSAGHLEVAKLLLESGGKPPAWLEGGRPIIFVAPASPEALKLLLAHGAPARDLHRGETALHALTWQANRGQIPAATQLEAAGILLEAGVDPSALNRSSQTAAQLAASLGLPELARFLEKPSGKD